MIKKKWLLMYSTFQRKQIEKKQQLWVNFMHFFSFFLSLLYFRTDDAIYLSGYLTFITYK
jgi:hypothetical protein